VLRSISQEKRSLAAPVDVVVSTPARFLQHWKAAHVAIGDLQWVVLDEADTMYDQARSYVFLGGGGGGGGG
jgi:superfamily II DNA/RNA helicase